MKNKKLKPILIILFIVAIILTVYLFYGKNDTVIIKAETVTVKQGTITTMVTATGTVEPLTKVNVGTQVSGEVAKIYVDYNSQVKKGQLLAELDKTNLKAVLQQAQASYENTLNEKLYFEKIYNRQKNLREQEVISQADFDDAEYNYNNSKSAVTQSLSNLQQALTNLGFANIYSPIDGVVLSREIDEGQTVAASFETPTLFTIARNLEQMQVEASVDEADIGNVREGQRVTFTVDAYPGEIFNGTVIQVRLNPSANETVVTYTVVIKAENPDLKLKPGLTATVTIYTLELNDVLTIEAKAINFKPEMELLRMYEKQKGHEAPPLQQSVSGKDESTTVWLHEANSRIIPKQIQTGARDGINVQITKGLKEGDQLVYSLKTLAEIEINSDSSSPFMPKPPGNNQRKRLGNE